MNDETEQYSTTNDAVTRLEDELALRRRKPRRKSRIITAVILVILTAVAVSSAVFLVTFWDRLSPGGVLMIHDVNSTQFRGPGRAVKAFCRERNLLPVPICVLHGSVLLRKDLQNGKS